VVLGRAITVVFAEENRKKPQEMRARDRARFIVSPQHVSLATYWVAKPSPSLLIIWSNIAGVDLTKRGTLSLGPLVIIGAAVEATPGMYAFWYDSVTDF
jgi:hypothetical protein